MKQCLEMFAEVSRRKDGHKKFHEQFCKRFQLGIHEDSTGRIKIAELLRFSSSSRPGDPEIVDVPLPEIHEEIVEVIQLIPRERLSECTVEQVVEQVVGVPFHRSSQKSLDW